VENQGLQSELLCHIRVRGWAQQGLCGDQHDSIVTLVKLLCLYAALQAGPEAVAKQVPRFSVTAAVRSAQLANKELAESRARRRRRREDYILLQATFPSPWLHPQLMSPRCALNSLHRQSLVYHMPVQLMIWFTAWSHRHV
jgi:hypothetical protein